MGGKGDCLETGDCIETEGGIMAVEGRGGMAVEGVGVVMAVEVVLVVGSASMRSFGGDIISCRSVSNSFCRVSSSMGKAWGAGIVVFDGGIGGSVASGVVDGVLVIGLAAGGIMFGVGIGIFASGGVLVGRSGGAVKQSLTIWPNW